MKRLIVGLMAILGWSSAWAALEESPVGESPADFEWTQWDARNFGVDYNETSFVHGDKYVGNDRKSYYTVSRTKAGPLDFTLRTLGPAITSQIVSPHYAIKGRIKYDNIPAGSYLEMASYFAPAGPGGQETVQYSRLTADSGPEARMEGTDDGRDFLLSFDSSAEKTRLVRIAFNLHLAGKSTLELWNVKLVQYQEAPATFKASGELIVSIRPGPVYVADGQEHSLDSLGKLLKERHQSDDKQAVVIRADKRVPYSSIVSLLDILKTANISNIAFAEGRGEADPAPPPPPPSSAPVTMPGPIVIELGEGGKKMTVEGTAYSSIESLQPALARQAGDKPGTSLLIKLDSTVAYPRQADLLSRLADAGKSAGIKDIAVANDRGQTLPPPSDLAIPPSGQTVMELPWATVPARPDGPPFDWDQSPDSNVNLNVLGIVAEKEQSVLLRTIPDLSTVPREHLGITTHHYALVGEVKTRDVAPGSYLEMWSHFLPPRPGEPARQFFTRGLAEVGPLRKLDGTQEWRPFSLPFDSTGAEAPLRQIDFALKFTGPGQVWLRQMRLVQYPDQPADTAPANVARGGLHWGSFFLGCFAFAAGSALAIGLGRLLRYYGRRRHEQELRRIASLDS